MSKFGDRLHVLRIKRGLSQAQLADQVNLKRSAIGNYERGIREPDLDTIELFADFFDVSMADIMGRDENEYLEEIIRNRQDSKTSQDQETPKTPEARAVSGWMDNLPEEQRKFIESIVATAISNFPEPPMKRG